MEFDRLILRTISCTTRRFHNYVRSECDKIGISSSYQGIIMVLSKNNGASQQDLAKTLVLAKPTISLTLQKMEYEGYIERRQDEQDARVTRVYITDKGLDANAKIKSIFKKMEKRIEEVLPLAKQNDLLAMLDTINNEISKWSSMEVE